MKKKRKERSLIIFIPGTWVYHAGRIFVFRRCIITRFDKKLGVNRPKLLPFCRVYFRNRK